MRVPARMVRTAAQAWLRLPDDLRRTTLTAASVLTDGPTLGLPRAERVLVVAPHPDDETIGAGGTIARLTARGARVVVVCATDGEATIGAPLPREEIAARRRAELVAACELLGTEPPIHLHLRDRGVRDDHDVLVRRLQSVADELEPELVLAPWPLDRHPDHLAVADAMPLLELHDTAELWGYEAHVPLPPTRVVDVSDTIEVKRAALAAHETAGAAFELDAMLGLSRWRSLLANAGRGHAEAFLAARWPDVLDLHLEVCGAGGRELPPELSRRA